MLYFLSMYKDEAEGDVMGKLRGLLVICVLSLFIVGQHAWTVNEEVVEEEDFVIGVLSFESKIETTEKWQPLATYLTEKIDKQTFTVLPLTYVEFDDALENGTVDYVLTNPAHFIAMSQEFHLSGAIATLTEFSNGVPQSSFGGVIFTRNEEGAPDSLEALKSKKISAVNRNSLGGYQASAYEFYKAGIPLNHLEFVLTGMPHKNTVEMVLKGQADAGFVRSGVIEGLIANGDLAPDALKIINPQSHKQFTEMVSTTLYPEWPFIAMEHIDPINAQEVAACLFLLHESETYTKAIGISGFTIPASYISVEDMMRVLKIAPFNKEDPITLSALWASYSIQILIGFVLLLGLSFYAINKHLTGKILTEKNETLNALTAELQLVNEQLHNLAIEDPLTGLYNRRYFEEQLEEKLEAACSDDHAVAICIVDVDHFKHYNDEYGHWVGDQVLTAVAHTLNDQEDKAIELVARYAGDEFIIILDDVTIGSAELIAHRIIKHMASLNIKVQGLDEVLKVTISMGIALSNQRGCNESKALFKAADRALLKAKEDGKNCYAVYYATDIMNE